MAYHLVFKPSARKELKSIPSVYKKRVYHAFTALVEDPFRGKKLSGEYAGHRVVRAWPYRIVYRIHGRDIVIIVCIGHRQGIYCLASERNEKHAFHSRTSDGNKGSIPRGSAARSTSKASSDNTSGLAPRNLY